MTESGSNSTPTSSQRRESTGHRDEPASTAAVDVDDVPAAGKVGDELRQLGEDLLEEHRDVLDGQPLDRHPIPVGPFGDRAARSGRSRASRPSRARRSPSGRTAHRGTPGAARRAARSRWPRRRSGDRRRASRARGRRPPMPRPRSPRAGSRQPRPARRWSCPSVPAARRCVNRPSSTPRYTSQVLWNPARLATRSSKRSSSCIGGAIVACARHAKTPSERMSDGVSSGFDRRGSAQRAVETSVALGRLRDQSPCCSGLSRPRSFEFDGRDRALAAAGCRGPRSGQPAVRVRRRIEDLVQRAVEALVRGRLPGSGPCCSGLSRPGLRGRRARDGARVAPAAGRLGGGRRLVGRADQDADRAERERADEDGDRAEPARSWLAGPAMGCVVLADIVRTSCLDQDRRSGHPSDGPWCCRHARSGERPRHRAGCLRRRFGSPQSVGHGRAGYLIHTGEGRTQRSAPHAGSGGRWTPTTLSSLGSRTTWTGRSRRLVLAHQDRCYSIALRMLGDPGAAEEAAQDALVRAYRALAGYDATRILELRLRPWLATIVLNLCRTRLARRASRGRAPAVARRRSRPGLAAGAGRDRSVHLADRRRGTPSRPRALGRPPRDPAARLPGRRRAATRRRPVLSRSRRRPRATRGHRQGPGPPRPGDVAYRTRDGEPPRARGDDRMTTDDLSPGDRHGRPGHDRADRLAPNVLVEVGLADRMARIDSVDRPALRRLERPGREWCRVRRVRGEPRGPHRSPGLPGRGAPRRPGTRDRPAARRRPPGPHRPRPARPQRLRTRRVAQGPRHPARRSPAVRLDRRRDRPTEGGPRGRDGARPQPGPAHRPVPSGRPDRRPSRPVLARRPREQAHDPGLGRPGPRRDGGGRAPWRAAGRLCVDEHRLLADVPHGSSHARRATAGHSARSRMRPRPAIGRARSVAP